MTRRMEADIYMYLYIKTSTRQNDENGGVNFSELFNNQQICGTMFELQNESVTSPFYSGDGYFVLISKYFYSELSTRIIKYIPGIPLIIPKRRSFLYSEEIN